MNEEDYAEIIHASYTEEELSALDKESFNADVNAILPVLRATADALAEHTDVFVVAAALETVLAEYTSTFEEWGDDDASN